MARRLTALAGLLALMGHADAQTLSDPTRPPFAAEAPAAPGAATSSTVLQSVILGKGRKSAALIGGQRVELGGRIGDARLVRITESEVVLDGPGGRQVLQLTPQALKRRPTAADFRRGKPR